MDQSLLESRARKWNEMGKPPFSGLAIGREYQEFQRVAPAGTATMQEYLSASRRLRWLIHGTICIVVVIIGLTVWLWQKGYSVEQAALKLRSFVVGIHIEPGMQPIPGGIFAQGDIHGGGRPEAQPVRTVSIKPFKMGTSEVTFEEYDRFASEKNRLLPGDQGWGRGRRPVINVSWQDANDYADWLSQQTGKPFRLPTESEWEYAARSGGKDQDWAGTSEGSQLKDYAVYETHQTKPVGGKKPNGLGLYDMSGNVWEWVKDCWHDNYEGLPRDGSAWAESGQSSCKRRVLRGGTWTDEAGALRASNRFVSDANDKSAYIGFRLVQDID
jgi:formylglycine-generating enzyme required for sulfatase activity